MTGSGISIFGAVKVSTTGTTGTGLDQIVDVITHDPGILASGSTASVNGGAQAANGLNLLILDAAKSTGALADGIFTTDEVRAMSAWVRSDPARYAQFEALHGDDEGNVETGYHLIQNNGGAFQFNSQNFANTVVDGIYHIGFAINDSGQFLNEDGNANASVSAVTRWLNQLYVDVIANNDAPLSRLAWGILGDSKLYGKFGIAAQREATAAADAMNAILAKGIAETGIASDGTITPADVVTLNAWLRGDASRLNAFLGHYGTAEKGFYRAVDDSNGVLFGLNLVNTVANGVYSLGFALVGDKVGSLSGAAGASLADVAAWLDYFAGNQPTLHAGTGLDKIVEAIFDDPGLAKSTPLGDIQGGAKAAAGLNALLIEAMDAVGARNDGWITPDELYAINQWVKADAARYARFVELHGDDEDGMEWGFHLVQNDGSALTMENRNLINTVADGIYHFGFDIRDGVFRNEDGDANQSVGNVATWLNELMKGVVTIRANGGTDAVTWTESAVQVIDSGGKRTITTGTFDDYINVTWSSDTILTGGGNDLIRAGQGDNIVDGGDGSDTYLYVNSIGDNFHGFDLIRDTGASGIDRIVASGADSTIGVRGFSGHGIEEIDVSAVTGKAVLLDSGASNTIDLRSLKVTGNLVIDSNWGNDTVFGSDAAETILGGWGDDALNGGGAGDTYLYADSIDGKFLGFDRFADSGATGVDRIVGTGANTSIGVIGFGPASGIEEIDVSAVTGKAVLLDSGASNTIDLRSLKVTGNLVIDSNWGNDTVFGSDAAETILGGWGDDALNGGGAGDTYLYADSIDGKFFGFDRFADSGATGVDRIVGTGANTSIGVIGFGPASGIEEIDVSAVTGKAVLLDSGASNTIDLRSLKVTGNLVIDSNWGNDTVFGSDAAETILGGWGDDALNGGGAGDTYLYADSIDGKFLGFDRFADSGATGVDRIVGTGANTSIGVIGFGPASGIEEIDVSTVTGKAVLLDSGASNTIDLRSLKVTGNLVIDSNWGNDTVFGSDAAETILGGWGDDALNGGGAGDTYLYADSIDGKFLGFDRFADSGATGVDRIVGTGANTSIGVIGFGPASGIEEIDVSTVTGKAVLLDSGASNTIDLRSLKVTGNLVIDSNWGNDTVFGSDAAETILGGWGDDALNGGGAGDTYLYADSIDGKFLGFDRFADSGATGVDRIVGTGANTSIGVIGFGPASGIEEIDVSTVTGKAVLLDSGASNTIDLRSLKVTGNLVVDGNWGNDTIFGSTAADFLKGGGGDDTIDGGTGNDSLSGGDGSDRFHVSANWGKDTITDFQVGKDKIDVHDAGIGSYSALTISASGSDTLVTSSQGSFLLLGIAPSAITTANFIF